MSWSGECAVKVGHCFEKMVKCYGYKKNRRTAMKMVSVCAHAMVLIISILCFLFHSISTFVQCLTHPILSMYLLHTGSLIKLVWIWSSNTRYMYIRMMNDFNCHVNC